MKDFLQHMVIGLKDFSKSLEKKLIFVDKPWALIDSDLEIQKLIFKKNKELIMSKDGQVTIGKWDYFPQADSILIDRGKDKILCNTAFIDEGVMILKLDGTKNNFFVLANENIIPDLNAYKYLNKLRYNTLNIGTRELSNGKILEVSHEDPFYEDYKDYGYYEEYEEYEDDIGDKVTINAKAVRDGVYKLKNKNQKYVIKSSVISIIIYEETYRTKSGLEIMVEQSEPNSYKVGERVWINGEQAPDGEYRIISARNIVVKDGVIIKKKIF